MKISEVMYEMCINFPQCHLKTFKRYAKEENNPCPCHKSVRESRGIHPFILNIGIKWRL
jgi:hypothetical protein